MRTKVLSGLVGALSLAIVLLLSAKVIDLKLQQVKYKDFPVCLNQRDGGEAYVIMEADEDAKTYTGVRVLAIFQMPFRLSAKSLNERPDLKVVDCTTGQPIKE